MAVAASSRLDSSTMNCSSSFQPKLLPSREQTDCFTKAFLLGFLPFGRIDPTHIFPPVGWRQLLEVVPRARIGLELFLDVRRHLRHRWPWGIAASARRRPLQ